MGYISEVAIKCEEKAFEMFKKVCKEVNNLPDKTYKDGNEYILHWYGIKWYEEYEDVRAIISVMNKLDELQDPDNYDETGYGYRFMRLGENDGDIETRENDWDIELYMIRQIDIPNDLKEINI